jgi:hypothetical protein
MWLYVVPVLGQPPEFTYQGRLADGGQPANGTYDFEFRLYDLASGGTLLDWRTRLGVQVTGGVFTVSLDFPPASFPGAPRFLEIAVQTGGGPDPYFTLSPRQALTSSPYAVRSLSADTATTAATATTSATATNANQLGGLSASGFVQNTTSPQAADYNITGGGAIGGGLTVGGTTTSNVFNAQTRYDIGNSTVLRVAGTDTLLVGIGAGAVNTGSYNTFVGASAGQFNNSAIGNSFFGRQAGYATTTGANNSFFGRSAGESNNTGFSNAFFGAFAGDANTGGGNNSFFGLSAGGANLTGAYNTLVGRSAGTNNTLGSRNTVVGADAGASNTTESDNTFLGYGANGAAGITNATAIGANAVVTTSNTMVLGTAAVTVTANIINAATQYNIGGVRVLAGQGNNTSAGLNAGAVNTPGIDNAFFGYRAGASNTSGFGNSIFGADAGNANLTGEENSFFGRRAGAVTSGSGNAFFGSSAGAFNVGGSENAYFGKYAGLNETSGNGNAFFGSGAGLLTTVASLNSFVGNNAGFSNTTGDNNTILGAAADVGANNLNFATAIGSGAVVDSSNTIVLGRSNGSDTVVVPGKLQVDTLGVAGATSLCLNGSNRIAPCSSSARYKTNIAGFRAGLSLVNRLRPISFNWKDGGMRDLGFGAEEVEKIEPLLVTYNAKGEVEGVKYDRINVLLVNALKEQQEQIEQQQELIRRQQEQLDRQQRQLESLQQYVYRKAEGR